MYIIRLINLWISLNVIICFKPRMNKPRMNKIEMRSKERKMTPTYISRSLLQEKYSESMKNNIITFGVGPAGTGKTLLACTYAIEQLKKDNIGKVIITRPIVPVEEDLGYLPGKINSKMEPWMRPIFDIFGEYYEGKHLKDMLSSGTLEIAPLAYMRGRTFKNTIVIADEMQNSSPSQMKMITTRLGNETKLIVTGDLKQSDRSEDNGLKDILNRIKNYKKDNITDIEVCEFGIDDIQRSNIVNELIKIYEDNDELQKRTKLPLPEIKETKENNEVKNGNDDAALIPLKHHKFVEIQNKKKG